MEHTSVGPANNAQRAQHGLIGRLKRINRLFLLTVLAPTVLATAYYGLFASDVYVSESRFIVHSEKPQQQLGLVNALLSGRADQDAYPVIDYIESRDALKELNGSNFIADQYSKHGDFLSRFHTGLDDSFEALWRYYGKHIVKVNTDETSGITILQVRAYSAENAANINAKLLRLSEALINRMNDRAATDTVEFAQREVEEAAIKAKTAASALAAYRNSHSLFDPDRQSTLRLQQITTLQTQMFAAQTQLTQLQAISPQNPQIPTLRTTIESLKKQIDTATGIVAGGQNSFSQKITDYERLQLESQFADKQLAAVMTAQESAREEAARKKLYLEEIVQPNTPDIAIEPKRLAGIATVFIIGLICWGSLSLLIASIREHRD